MIRQGRSKQPVLGTLGYGQQSSALFEEDPGGKHDALGGGLGQHDALGGGLGQHDDVALGGGQPDC